MCKKTIIHLLLILFLPFLLSAKDEVIKDYKYHSLNFRLPINWVLETKVLPPSEFDGMEELQIKGINDQSITILRIPDFFVRIDSSGEPLPPIDRGMMVIAEKNPITVAGINTSLIKTEVFFGNSEEVLVVYLKIEKFTYAIFCKNVSKNNFLKILETFKIKKSKSEQID